MLCMSSNAYACSISNVTGGLFMDKEHHLWLPRSSETATEDVFIRKFISGTFSGLVLSEVVIKRRGNLIVLAFLVRVSNI